MVTPERLLELLLRPLPADRAAWKDALRAELAALDDPRERWAFARSCWRLPVRALAGPRAAGLGVLTVLAGAEVFDVTAHPDWPGSRHLAPIVACLLLWYLAVLLAATAHRSPLPRRALVVGGLAALAAAAAWLTITLLSATVGGDPAFPVATAAIAALAAASFADPGARSRAGAALWAAGGAALLIPSGAFVTLDLSPLWAAPSARPHPLAADPTAARDAYTALFLVALLAAATLTPLVIRRRRASANRPHQDPAPLTPFPQATSPRRPEPR
ncbi:hypothetical protein [Dactylosporangium sp. CA-092794]|uniref:hypothetical protein n=1 Tax=Dactylosporangium sp. CA-092794 TaxID=3239929 RepID=UPI003D8F0FCB